VLAVDDFCQSREVEGIPVCSSAAFLKIAPTMKDAVAIDFSQTAYAHARYKQLGLHTGMPVHDVLEVLAAFDAPSVYQTVPTYREKTLARADDWLRLADRLADDQSRETLYAVLLQRLEYDRKWLNGVMISGRDEYFGQSNSSETFVLGSREHFVDGGAHRGTVISKLLGLTDWQYSAIHAFEPDRENFAALSSLSPVPLHDFHTHNKAISDKTEILKFSETGTMGSHITEAGTVTVPCVSIDETVENATFIKLDVEGFEPKALRGAARLIKTCRPRMAIASYHYAQDILEVVETIDNIAPDYTIYLRHHFGYFYDTIVYATPRNDWQPIDTAI